MSLLRRQVADLGSLFYRPSYAVAAASKAASRASSVRRCVAPICTTRPRILYCPQRQSIRSYSSDSPTAHLQPPEYLSEAEKSIFEKLKSDLQPTRLEVQDISGGCGSMFGLDIVSAKFQGLSTIKQHQMVNRVLAEEIKGWHGMQLKTKAAE